MVNNVDKTLDKEKPKKYEERLMIAFAFDEDDLEANEKGYLSQDQFGQLQAKYKKSILELLLLSFFALVLSPLIFSAISTLIMSLVVSVAVLAVLGFALVPNIYRLRKDLNENRVLVSEGRIELSDKHEQDGIRYFLYVNQIRFPISKKRHSALKNWDPYLVYYTPHTKRIMSVEWLRDGNDNFVGDGKGEDESEALNTAFAPPDEKPKRLME